MVNRTTSRRTALLLVFSTVVCVCGVSTPSAQERIYYVTGFVKAPGSYRYPDARTITVRVAIADAGGLSENGSSRRLVIVRKVDGELTEIAVTLSSMVEPGDIIRIPRRLQ